MRTKRPFHVGGRTKILPTFYTFFLSLFPPRDNKGIYAPEERSVGTRKRGFRSKKVIMLSVFDSWDWFAKFLFSSRSGKDDCSRRHEKKSFYNVAHHKRGLSDMHISSMTKRPL